MSKFPAESLKSPRSSPLTIPYGQSSCTPKPGSTASDNHANYLTIADPIFWQDNPLRCFQFQLHVFPMQNALYLDNGPPYRANLAYKPLHQEGQMQDRSYPTRRDLRVDKIENILEIPDTLRR